ncbi:unnamed protein product [Prorocentrum cordatum]|uniref:Uncharacterized protein n=1 Tax=Prorocentrum cordatum TaxID=2364126 RepID=A0ABN9XEQ6_9DINO|nr:unnamed protein product [Polarella glacialis]
MIVTIREWGRSGEEKERWGRRTATCEWVAPVQRRANETLARDAAATESCLSNTEPAGTPNGSAAKGRTRQGGRDGKERDERDRRELRRGVGKECIRPSDQTLNDGGSSKRRCEGTASIIQPIEVQRDAKEVDM